MTAKRLVGWLLIAHGAGFQMIGGLTHLPINFHADLAYATNVILGGLILISAQIDRAAR